MLEINKIHLGDCLKLMKEIPNNSIDAIITDPPYGTNDKYGKVIKRKKTLQDFSVIEWDKKFPLDYLPEYYRIMKDDTWGIVFIDKKEVTTFWNELEKNNLKPRNTFYWIKTNKAPTPRSNFKSCVEEAVIFTKGRTNKKWNGGGITDNYFSSGFVLGKEKVNHPTQKPLKLITKFIKLISNENDIILDSFVGSGTTGVACLNTNRNFIGIEINEEYFKIAKKRLEETKNNISTMYEE